MNSPAASARNRRQATVPVRPAPVLRREHLRNQFPSTVDALRRGRADLVPDGFIADYVALDWLEWNGGALRATLTGANICKQVQAGLA